jgi:hypothetical protein
MFAVFMVKCGQFSKANGLFAMITQHSWMFLKSFTDLRANMMKLDTINMAHLGARAFEEIAGEVVQTTTFVKRNSYVHSYSGNYVRLVDYASQKAKEDGFLSGKNRYHISSNEFSNIEDSPIAYWVPDKLFKIFKTAKQIGNFGDARVGMQTGENDKFIRMWEEIDYNKLCINAASADLAKKSGCKWFPYNKGGEARKWYGNNDWVVDWFNDGQNIKEDKLYKLSIGECLPSNSKPKNMQYYFRPSITWSKVASGMIAFRYKKPGSIFDIAGASIFTSEDLMMYMQGYCNSIVATFIAFVLSPTINYEAGTVSKFPLVIDAHIKPHIEELVSKNIILSEEDDNSFETSWGFKIHPLAHGKLLSEAYDEWCDITEKRFSDVKENEEELNRQFISIYGLGGELEYSINPENISIHRADLKREIKSLISFAVGCMFGRYSLDTEGIVYAGGKWDESKYKCYPVDRDNIIPICDDEYFDDDIIGLFVRFVETVYGKDTLNENLKFIADALGGKGTPQNVIRNYFINDFFSDHCSMYSTSTSGKRPIYWLFDSGKKNGFKCLIYMHRYQPDTIARIRTDYVHEQQARYRTAIAGLERQIVDASTSERVRLNKQLSKLKDQAEEVRVYEEKIHHLADQMISIDLDDGVKHNYEIFQDVLAKIK